MQAIVDAFELLGRADCSFARHQGGGGAFTIIDKSIEFHIVQDDPAVASPVVVVVAIKLNHGGIVVNVESKGRRRDLKYFNVK